MKSPALGELAGRYDGDCPATRALLTRVGDKWSVSILAILGAGTLRFHQLKRSAAGISQRVLTSTLRGLERDGIVARTVHPTKPPQVEYALTSLGRALLEPVSVLASWAERHRGAVEEAQGEFDRQRTRRA